jgi:hypothetical protein
MTVLSKVGSFNSGTGAAASTVAVTGVGFQPKAVIFWWTGQTGTSDAEAGQSSFFGYGAATGASERFACTVYDEDGAANSNCGRVTHTDACVAKLASVSTLDGLLDFTSFDSDGFTLTVDDQFSASIRIHYLALGGTDLLAYAGVVTTTTASATFDVTDAGFEPTGLIFLYGQATASGTIGTNAARFGFGLTDGTTQIAMSLNIPDNGATEEVEKFASSSHVYVNQNAPTTNNFSFVSFLSTGFRLNFARTASQLVPYLAIGGAPCKVGDVAYANDTTPFTETGVGFEPVAGLFMTHGATAYNGTTADTASDLLFSVGASDGTDRVAASWFSDDGATTSDVRVALEHDEIAIAQDTAGIAGLLDLTSFDSDGMTLVMDDAFATASLIPYFLIGPASSGTAYTLASDLGTFALTGVAAAMQQARKVAAAVGTFVLTGIDAALKAARSMAANLGTFTFTGIDAALNAGKTLAIEAGEFLLTGVAALFPVTLSMLAAVGTFTFTGIAAAFQQARKIAANVGSFILNGVDVILIVGGSITMAVEAGVFIVAEGVQPLLTWVRARVVDVSNQGLEMLTSLRGARPSLRKARQAIARLTNLRR